MRKGWNLFIIIAAAVVVLAAAFVIFISQINKKLDVLIDIPVKDIDLSAISDGTYKGSYSAFPIEVEVKVAVKSNCITAIDLIKHTNGKGKAAEVIPGLVLSAQSLKGDTITGATYSSKVIILAIQDALTKAATDT